MDQRRMEQWRELDELRGSYLAEMELVGGILGHAAACARRQMESGLATVLLERVIVRMHHIRDQFQRASELAAEMWRWEPVPAGGEV